MAKKLIRKPETEEGAPEWMMTFGDLMSQLLTFFILLISFSLFDEVKYNRIKGALEYSFGVLPGWETPIVFRERVIPERQRYNNEEERMQGIGYKLKMALAQQGKGENLKVDMTKEGLRLTLQEIEGRATFESGTAKLTPEPRQVLDRIVEQIKKEFPGHGIRVEGHTDSQPINTPNFSSNWDLSIARARSVQKYLIEHGIDESRTSIAGHAHAKPIADENTTDPDAKRRAMIKNRRVEILVVRQFQKGNDQPTQNTESQPK